MAERFKINGRFFFARLNSQQNLAIWAGRKKSRRKEDGLHLLPPPVYIGRQCRPLREKLAIKSVGKKWVAKAQFMQNSGCDAWKCRSKGKFKGVVLFVWKLFVKTRCVGFKVILE